MSENDLVNCWKLYSLYDKNSNNQVPIQELKKMLISFGLNISQEEANIIIKGFQKDTFKDHISFEEFYSITQIYNRDHEFQRKELLDAFIQLEEQGENFEQHSGNIIVEELIHQLT